MRGINRSYPFSVPLVADFREAEGAHPAGTGESVAVLFRFVEDPPVRWHRWGAGFSRGVC